VSLVKFASQSILATILCACSSGQLQDPAAKITPKQMGSVKIFNKRVQNDINGESDKFKDLYIASLLIMDFPPGKVVTFSTKRVLQKDPDAYVKHYTFKVSKNGVLTTPDGELDEFLLPSTGYALGERVECRFETSDGALRNDFSYVPRPFVLQSSDVKWKAEIEMVSPEIFMLKVSGLNEFEACKFFTKSCSEEICDDFIYEAKSNFVIIMPAVIGKSGGTCSFKLERMDGSTVEGSFPWGSDIKA
jgi:hypothetical protein